MLEKWEMQDGSACLQGTLPTAERGQFSCEGCCSGARPLSVITEVARNALAALDGSHAGVSQH